MYPCIYLHISTSVVNVTLFLLVFLIVGQCDVYLSSLNLFYLHLTILNKGQTIQCSNLLLTLLCSLSLFVCRWNMDDMQVEYLQTAKSMSVGIYGWRKRCLYGLLIFLTFIVLINLCLTFWLSAALGLHWVRARMQRSTICSMRSII